MPYNEKIEQRINNLELSTKCDKKNVWWCLLFNKWQHGFWYL